MGRRQGILMAAEQESNQKVNPATKGSQVGKTTPSGGYTKENQTQWMNGENAVATILGSVNKGGMRGVGLLAVTLAEAKLKVDTYKLARDYYNTNKKDYDFFKSTHQAPIQASAQDAMSNTTNPPYVADFYASAPAGMAASAQIDKSWWETMRRTGRYARGLRQKITYEMALIRAHAIVGGWNTGRRYELTFADEHNNRRFDRKVEIANIGLGVGNIVAQGLASSVSKLAAAQDNLGDIAATIGNGLAAQTGYNKARQNVSEAYGDGE